MRDVRPNARLSKRTTARVASLAVLVILVASFMTFRPTSGATAGATTTVYTTANQAWADQQLVAWAPTSVQKINFGAVLQSISYSAIAQPSTTPQVVSADLSMVEQTGSPMIRVDLGYDAWLNNDAPTEQAADSYIHMVNSTGRLLVLADSSAEKYRSSPLSWTNFQAAWLQRVQTLAARYHPYAYIVVKESGWYYPMISDSKVNAAVYDPNVWGNLTAKLASAVKAASPSTLVGVAEAAYGLYNNSAYQGKVSFSVQFLQRAEKIPAVDFIGFDIYDPVGFQGTQTFLNTVGSGGKAVWIAEAWSQDCTCITDPSRSTLDQTWIQVLYYYALLNHVQVVIPFYTDIFASYGAPPTDSAGLVQFYQQRTPVFNEFEKIVSTNAAGQLLNPTTTTTSSSSSKSSTSTSPTTSTSSTSSSSSTTATTPTTSSTSSTSSRQSTTTSTSVTPTSTSSTPTLTSPSQTTSTSAATKSGSPFSLILAIAVIGVLLLLAGVIFSRRARTRS